MGHARGPALAAELRAAPGAQERGRPLRSSRRASAPASSRSARRRSPPSRAGRSSSPRTTRRTSAAAKALGRLEGVPDAAEQGSAGCLRGRALARLKRCDEAVVALAACATATSDALLAEAQLTCLVALERGRRRARLRRPDHPPRRRCARGAQGDRPIPEPRIPAPTPDRRRRQWQSHRPRGAATGCSREATGRTGEAAQKDAGGRQPRAARASQPAQRSPAVESEPAPG